MQVDSRISQAVRDANKISMIKNAFGDTTLTAEKSSFKRNTTNLWPEFGFFKQQPCDYGMGKENQPESTVFYINQAYHSYKDNKKVYYADFFIIGQIKYCLSPPENIESYEFKEREAKMYRPGVILLQVNSQVCTRPQDT